MVPYVKPIFFFCMPPVEQYQSVKSSRYLLLADPAKIQGSEGPQLCLGKMIRNIKKEQKNTPYIVINIKLHIYSIERCNVLCFKTQLTKK